MRSLLGVFAAGLIAALPASVHAEPFDDLAAKAIAIGDNARLGALFWAATVDCSSPDDLIRRQCEGVRTARAQVLAGQTFVAPGDASALIVGDYDPARGGVPVSVRGCIACRDAIDLAGERRYVVSPGPVGIAGGEVLGPELVLGLQVTPSEDQAKVWKTAGGSRLKVDFVFRVPAVVPTWTQAGAHGFSVEFLGYRVWDPCDGKIFAANPPAAARKADKTQCQGEPVAVAPTSQPTTPIEDTLPRQLSLPQIKQAMQPAIAEVNGCFATYGVAGRADVTMTILGNGTVKKVDMTGDFTDTPTGDCIVKAVEHVEFPKFQRQEMVVPWPFILR
jgi:hypothetical protein